MTAREEMVARKLREVVEEMTTDDKTNLEGVLESLMEEGEFDSFQKTLPEEE